MVSNQPSDRCGHNQCRDQCFLSRLCSGTHFFSPLFCFSHYCCRCCALSFGTVIKEHPDLVKVAENLSNFLWHLWLTSYGPRTIDRTEPNEHHHVLYVFASWQCIWSEMRCFDGADRYFFSRFGLAYSCGSYWIFRTCWLIMQMKCHRIGPSHCILQTRKIPSSDVKMLCDACRMATWRPRSAANHCHSTNFCGAIQHIDDDADDGLSAWEMRRPNALPSTNCRCWCTKLGVCASEAE